MDMTEDCTQVGQDMTERSLWAYFTNAMRELPAGADAMEDGWLRARRGRVKCAEPRPRRGEDGTPTEAGEHGILNLNLVPDMPNEVEKARAGGGGVWQGALHARA